MVLQICNFWFKTYLTEKALAPLFVKKFAKKIKNLNLQTNLTLGCLKVVSYYCVLLSNLHLKSADFRR